MKMKYGAWYLKPTSWKIRSVNEDLENSVELEKREQSESKIRSEVVDKELSTIHGSRAFRFESLSWISYLFVFLFLEISWNANNAASQIL